MVSLDGLHKGNVIDSSAVLCGTIHTIAHGNMEHKEELHPSGRAENIGPIRASSISFEDAILGDVMVVDMQIFTVSTENFKSALYVQCLHAVDILHMYDILLYRFTNQQELINYVQSYLPKKTERFESVTAVVMKNTL